jgi:hypothetical protein
MGNLREWRQLSLVCRTKEGRTTAPTPRDTVEVEVRVRIRKEETVVRLVPPPSSPISDPNPSMNVSIGFSLFPFTSNFRYSILLFPFSW